MAGELTRQFLAERAETAAAVQALARRCAALESENERLAAGLMWRAGGHAWTNGDEEHLWPGRPWCSMPHPANQVRMPLERRCSQGDSCCSPPTSECLPMAKAQPVREEAWRELAASAKTLADRAAGLRAVRARLAGGVVEAPPCELIQRLQVGGDDKVPTLCNQLAPRVPLLSPADALRLAETLLTLMSPSAPLPECRYWPTISLMELLCTSRQCIEALPAEVLKRLLSSIREHMAYCSRMRGLDSWDERLQMADRASAALLNSVSPHLASNLLEELSLCRSELLDSPFLVACIDDLRGCRADDGAGSPCGDRGGLHAEEGRSCGEAQPEEEAGQPQPAQVPADDKPAAEAAAASLAPMAPPATPTPPAPCVPALLLPSAGAPAAASAARLLLAPSGQGEEPAPLLVTPRGPVAGQPREGAAEDEQPLAGATPRSRRRRRKRRSGLGA